MAADTTLITANGAVQASPTATTKLSNIVSSPQTRLVYDRYTIADALEAGDKIRVRKVAGGSQIVPVYSDIVEASTASALTLDVGIYQVAADGTIGTVVDKDILADGVDFAGAGVYTLAPYTLPTAQPEYWIVAEVMAVTGTTVAAETIDFYTTINYEN